jgi:hypothetical protein
MKVRRYFGETCGAGGYEIANHKARVRGNGKAKPLPLSIMYC